MTQQLTLTQTAWVSDNIATVLDRMRGKDFCADDIHGLVSEPMHPNYYGKLIGALVQAGKIKRVGSMPSKRPSRKHSWVGVYIVVE